MSDETKPCADCGGLTPVMIVLRSPKGPWQLCSRCFRLSLQHAEEARKESAERLAALEQKHQRQTHHRERIGSH